MAGVNAPYRFPYEHVAVSQTAHVLGGTGAIGDYLDKIICTVSTAATSSVAVLDGSTSHTILPNNVGGGLGVYVIPMGAISRNGPWKITTGAGVEVLALGIFSA